MSTPTQPIDLYLLAGQSNMVGSIRQNDLPDVLTQPHPTTLAYLDTQYLDPTEEMTAAFNQWQALAPGLNGTGLNGTGGFGPELSFGHTLAALTSPTQTTPIGIFKCARGGASLSEDWAPTPPSAEQAIDNRQMFPNCIAAARKAFSELEQQGYQPRWAGLAWYQGEAEANPTNTHTEKYGVPDAAGYAAMLANLFAAFRNELQTPNLPCVAVRVNASTPQHTNLEAIKQGIVDCCNNDPLAAWVDIDDLPQHDNLHLDGPQQLICGDRLAHAMHQLNQNQAPPVDIPTNTAANTPTEAPAVQPAPEPVPVPQRPALDQPRIIAMLNQKGGVGKTTTTVNVGAALSELGYRVLLIDLDPQGHLSLSVGVDIDQLEKSIYDLLADDDTTALEIIQELNPNLGVLPAEVNLAGVEGELADRVMTGTAQTVLRSKCADLTKTFDYVLLDCPPSLGLLTINALTLATEVIVPMQAHFLALQGMSKLFETVSMVQQGMNPNLDISGVVLCMHERQTLLASDVVGDIQGFLEQSRDQNVPWRNAVVFQPPIRRNIKLAESPSFGQSIFSYDAQSNGAKDYAALAKSIAGITD